MKKFWIISTFFVILVVFSYFVLYPLWGRRLIYANNSKVTKYAGSGQVTGNFNEVLFVLPKGEGRPKFAPVGDREKFKDELYDVITIPSQTQLLYTVGTFEKWEEIEGSLDKYLVIKNPRTKKLEWHRVASKYSGLFKENITRYFVENVNISLNKNKVNNVITTINMPTFKKGDAVILIPLFDPPELAKMDEVGNYLVSGVIVRRVGGKDD